MSKLVSSEVIAESGVVFGTSGARGLVTKFSSDVCAAFTLAFTAVMKQEFQFVSVALAIDNRPSSYPMAMACAGALKQVGINPVFYGVVPTPALAYQAMQDKIPCIMITGSHIPFDRNGLKFYRPDGEITKGDEASIVKSQVIFDSINVLAGLELNRKAELSYVSRYTSLFDKTLLVGKRIGIYEHSSAGRDLYAELFTQLGAEIISLGRSNDFVPIDTEAVSDEDRVKARAWVNEYDLDAIFSTDGDGDRPLICDEVGEWLRGDVLGMLAASALNIEALVVPISCSTAVERTNQFKLVERTKIGSPYVIAEFPRLNERFNTVAGFEANGGFLLGSDVVLENGGVLKALPTRDALLPTIMLLAASNNIRISELVAQLPKRFTYSERIKNFSREKTLELISELKSNLDSFLIKLGFEGVEVTSIDETDGLRLTFKDGRIIHLRPSGNSPELRCYAEAQSFTEAEESVLVCLGNIQNM